MEMLEEFRIRGAVWRTEFVSSLPKEGDKDVLGFCDYARHTVYLVRLPSRAATYQVWLHEVAHAQHPGWEDPVIDEVAVANFAFMSENGLSLVRSKG